MITPTSNGIKMFVRNRSAGVQAYTNITLFFCFQNCPRSQVCARGTSPMIVQHLLQNCLTHPNHHAETWPADTPVRVKLYGP